MTYNEIATAILERYTQSIISGRKLDLHDLIALELEKVGKTRYKEGYTKAKEKWRNANTSNP